MNKNKTITVRNKVNRFFEMVVHFYIYGAIVGLIFYMIATLATKLFHTIEKLFSQSASKGSMTHIQYELLHNIAFTVVLVKAYNILMEYAKHKHISIKYIIEIAIIAPVVEIIFNYNSYDFKMLIFLGVLAVFMSGLYLIFYDKLKLAEEDHDNDHK